MPLTRSNWNVVVIGRWNRSILTPQGIASRLFELPEGAEIDIEVPMDAIGPYRVSHEGLVVMASNVTLVVEPIANDFRTLQRAMQISRRAMVSLPETPVTVAGFNIRFEGSNEDQRLSPLIEATQLFVDQRLLGEGYRIFRRDINWVTDWLTGKIGIMLTRENGDTLLRVNLNFECAAGRTEMLDWLARPVAEVRAQAERILTTVLQLPMEAIEWGP